MGRRPRGQHLRRRNRCTLEIMGRASRTRRLENKAPRLVLHPKDASPSGCNVKLVCNPVKRLWQSTRYEITASILHDPCICNRCRFQAFALHAFSHLCTRLLPGFAGAIRGMRRLAYHCGSWRAVGHQVRPRFRARARVRPPVLGRAHRRQRSAAGGGPSDCPAKVIFHENRPIKRGPVARLGALV